MKSGQAGFSILETTIAMGVFAIVIVVSSYQIESGKELIFEMQRRFAVDTVETFLMDSLSQPEVLTATLDKTSKNSRIVRCIRSNSYCKHRSSYPLPVYLAGDKRPISGSSKSPIQYSRSGKRCSHKINNKQPCRGFKIHSSITTYCQAGKHCKRPSHVALQYHIISEKGRTLRKGYVEQLLKKDDLFTNIRIGCPKDSFLRGIGINGKPMCVASDDLSYATGSQPTLKIKPDDCRKLNKKRSDQYFVSKVQKNGRLKCSPKSW